MDVDKLVDYGLPNVVVGALKKRGIRSLNPVQTEAVKKGLLSGRNLVVASPTASGKTLIGELALVRTALKGGMGLYLVPLRALASEKYDEFKNWQEVGLRIGISTGDYESPGEYLARYNIVVATYERFDSLLRLRPRWLNRIRTIVIDELHMIGDPERGPVLEMIIARLRNTGVQVVGLSATINNADVLAEWLEGELVRSDWRPVKLVEGAFDRRRHTIVFVDGRKEKVVHRLGSSALSIALHSVERGIQVLVFVNNRRKAEEWAFRLSEHMNILAHLIDKNRLEELLSKLSESPSKKEREMLEKLIRKGIAYHHAGLTNIARKVVEEAFRERIVKAVFATPTLAAGVNLPARRVLVSIKRYDPYRRRMVGIPVFEYKQMAGRAGRPMYDDIGEAIIYDATSISEASKYIRGEPEPVVSRLNNERSLRIHTLSLIATGQAQSIKELIKVYKETLFFKQYGSTRYLENLLDNIVDELIDWDMVRYSSGVLEPTRIGMLTAITYLDPLSVHRYFSLVKDGAGAFYLLHLIAYTPDYLRSKPYINYKVVDYLEPEAWDLAEEGVIPEPPQDEFEYQLWLQAFVQAKMLHDWINEVSEDIIVSKYSVGPGDIYSARDTAAWIASGLSRIERQRNPDIADKLEKLSMRLEYGVKEDALELVKIEGIGRVRARVLLSHGIRSIRDLAKLTVEELSKLPTFGPKISETVIREAKARIGVYD